MSALSNIRPFLLSSISFGFPGIALSQASDGGAVAGKVVEALRKNTSSMSTALGDGISYAFAFIGLVMCVVGFYQLFFTEGSKVKAIYTLIGAFACLGIGGVVTVFLG